MIIKRSPISYWKIHIRDHILNQEKLEKIEESKSPKKPKKESKKTEPGNSKVRYKIALELMSSY